MVAPDSGTEKHSCKGLLKLVQTHDPDAASHVIKFVSNKAFAVERSLENVLKTKRDLLKFVKPISTRR